MSSTWPNLEFLILKQYRQPRQLVVVVSLFVMVVAISLLQTLGGIVTNALILIFVTIAIQSLLPTTKLSESILPHTNALSHDTLNKFFSLFSKELRQVSAQLIRLLNLTIIMNIY